MEQAQHPRIVIVHSGWDDHFATRDRTILQRRWPVETVGFARLSDLPRLRSKVRQADVVIFWFVGRAAAASMFPRPKGPKIIALVGGYEAARIKEFAYGSALSCWKRRVIQWIFRKSDRIVAVSNFTRRELNVNYGVPESDVTVIYNAIDTGFFVAPPPESERTGVFTAAHLAQTLIRKKGFDILVETARRLPEIQFTVAGRLMGLEAERFVQSAPTNLDFLGEISQDKLLRRLQTAQVYFQPSRHESFGVGVIEAMACGCVPVVSNLGALPEVMGNAGFVLDRLEADHAAEILRQALGQRQDARERARARVVECFDISRRAERLSSLIDELLGDSPPR